jgi:hypothetical protein
MQQRPSYPQPDEWHTYQEVPPDQQQSPLPPNYVPAGRPPLPPPHPPERRSHKKLWIIIAAALALLVIVSAGALQAGHYSPSSQQPQASPTQQAAPMPTTTKVATKKVTKALGIAENDAVLGGRIVAFNNKFGDNNCCHNNGWDTNTMWVGVYTAEDGGGWYQAVGKQSHERVVGIYINPYNSSGSSLDAFWPGLQAAKKVCDAYLPPGAKFQTTYQYVSTGVVIGTVNEYYSPLLARALPGSDFTDVNGHLEKPGLFFVFFSNHASAPSQIDHCVLGTDRSLQREGVSS